jgi:hypothetical protein
MQDNNPGNEKDIQTILRYLKIHDPKNANREYAEQMLEGMQSFGSELARTDEKLAEAVKQATAKKKP